MKSAPLPTNEEQRIAKLLSYNILDTSAETAYDDLTLIAAHICQTPVALVSFVDRDRQWFKSKIGLEADQTSRDVAFCAHALLKPEVLVIPDATQDERFADNPLVASEPHIRFYAGTPLMTPDGCALGTLCVIDYQPRQLTPEQYHALEALGRQVIHQLELRLKIAELNHTMEERDRTQEELCGLNQQLEQRVEDRTTELNTINIQLRDEIVVRQATEQGLQQSQIELKTQADHLQAALEQLKQTQSQLVQAEKISALGLLIAGIAHEINNPLSFVSGNLEYGIKYVDQLLQVIHLYQTEYSNPSEGIQSKINEVDLDHLTTDLPKLMTSMRVGTQRIREIINSLRNFSRSNNEQRQPVDLQEGINSTLMILRHRLKPQAHRSEIQIRQVWDELPPVVCYGGQLNQVFMNLIANAIDALDETCTDSQLGYVPLITIHTQKMSDDWVSISIIDNGPGMPTAVKSRIFEPLFTTKAVGKGTGLGLSISHQIVTQAHQGRLFCYSTPGEGTEFRIEIPLRSPTTAEAAQLLV